MKKKKIGGKQCLKGRPLCTESHGESIGSMFWIIFVLVPVLIDVVPVLIAS